jgi:hypothetical protein
MKVIGAALVCLFVVASVALAALPRAGRIYKGTSTANHKVKIVAETKHNLSLLRVVDSCDTVTKWTDVKVKDDGTFKAVKSNGDVDYYTVTGKFTRRSKAKGSISQVTCSGEPGDYVAKIQPQ